MPDQDRDYNRNQNRRNEDWRERSRQDRDDWGRQVPWDRGQGEYRDYGWERGESALPEFRDPSVHTTDYDRESMNRSRQDNWRKEGPFKGVGPKNYRRSDDRIMEDVCERLTQHGQIDARNIQVNVQDGEVTLEGSIDNRRSKRLVEDVVDEIRGVRDIHNHLRVTEGSGFRQGPGMGRQDEFNQESGDRRENDRNDYSGSQKKQE